MTRILAKQGDLTLEAVDGIVNAANEKMLGGGGVDGAIHRAAGRQLYEACLEVPEVRPGVRCPTGEARITPGFRLAARYVIHTVGPVYRGPRDAGRLASAHRSSLRLAVENGLTSIAFPAISCGIFGYPIEQAASIAIESTLLALRDCSHIEQVIFACFDAEVEVALIQAASHYSL